MASGLPSILFQIPFLSTLGTRCRYIYTPPSVLNCLLSVFFNYYTSSVLILPFMYQVISNDRHKSVLHRAVVNFSKERISIPTFYCPSPDAVIGPAKELVNDDHPAVYRDFTYGEYYEKFWNRGLASECCLDMFKAD